MSNASPDDPWIGLAKHRGGDVVLTTHKGRKVEVQFSPKGSSVRVYVDGEEWKPWPHSSTN